MKLPPEISFLSEFLIEPKELYSKATWLISDFHAPIWRYSFDYKRPREIDWNVTLDDGSSLTDRKNHNLLECLKYYATSSTKDSAGYGGETNAMQGQQQIRFYQAFHIIDYLLLNSGRLQLSKFGLAGLTSGNLIEILETISAGTSHAESIYNWTANLKNFCITSLENTDKNEILKVLKAIPQISIITPDQKDNDSLGVPAELIPSVRATLHLKKYYHSQIPYGQVPNSVKLSREILTGCVFGKTQSKPVHEILCFNMNVTDFRREHSGVPVTTGENEITRDKTFITYRTTLYKLGTLHELGLPAPTVDALIESERFSPELSTTGRFRTIPSSIVFNSLKDAIEFHLKNGEKIINGFCRLAIFCKNNRISPTGLTSEELLRVIGGELESLGVKQLGLSVKTNGMGYNENKSVKGDKQDYFKKLRSNAGLLELMCIYIGSVQLVVGVIMARRASELYELSAEGCLDKTEKWMLYRNAKTTRHLFGIRRVLARPIEPIAADMIKNLVRMQRVLVRVGYIKKMQTLFSTPSLIGLPSLTNSSEYLYNRNLDFVCDYFQTPFNKNGQRYYFRQHQLRRFFAMVFFYSGSFSKIDTLQWMLGHTDPYHVWRYITESTDGAVLRGVSAQYVAEAMHDNGVDDYTELATLIRNRFGTDDFALIDTNELEDHIQDLMKEGLVEIEPEFFTDENGKHFKVVARIARQP